MRILFEQDVNKIANFCFQYRENVSNTVILGGTWGFFLLNGQNPLSVTKVICRQSPMHHPSCYLTSIMDKTHRGPVIAFFLSNFISYLSYVGGIPVTNHFSLFIGW